ncbi:MAG TPA: hypothetical protein VJ788_06835 [Gemmatimonadota bacterium]|nr:hypothetical protein [Gemmatimonadota bacterium]
MVAERREPDDGADVIEELRRLGRQMGETLGAAWRSAERRKVQEELRAGARAFVDECERAMGRAGSARPADVASRARRSTVEALRWISAELEELADRFTPPDPPEARRGSRDRRE